MKEERIWILLARKLADEITANELNELSNLLNNNEDL